jgi:prepilin-type N-terminal cleavage/methylation domain-containing protein
MNAETPQPAPADPRRPRRAGFTLVEVILAVGVIGIAIASLVGILTSTFQQVDDVLQTNRALTAAQGLITALDNPRSILRDLTVSGVVSTNTTASQYLPGATDPDAPGTPSTLDNATSDASNFELAYKLLNQAKDADSAVWVYVYERNVVRGGSEIGSTGTQLNINANPALVEVVLMGNQTFPPDLAIARSVIGAPMRVRLTLSRLLVGQRVNLDTATGEPTAVAYAAGDALPADPNAYALAHLPLVAEFFPHDFTAPATFKAAETQPVLTQTLILNR